jgi:hypothetical protein
MGLYEFRRKSISQQVFLIGQSGIKLIERSVGTYQVSLNYMEDFFVEIWLSPKQHRVVRLVSFRDRACFEPYLYFINLSELQ